jgi:hypothetical protein
VTAKESRRRSVAPGLLAAFGLAGICAALLRGRGRIAPPSVGGHRVGLTDLSLAPTPPRPDAAGPRACQRIGEFWGFPKAALSLSPLIDCEEDRTVRAVPVGGDRRLDTGNRRCHIPPEATSADRGCKKTAVMSLDEPSGGIIVTCDLPSLAAQAVTRAGGWPVPGTSCRQLGIASGSTPVAGP